MKYRYFFSFYYVKNNAIVPANCVLELSDKLYDMNSIADVQKFIAKGFDTDSCVIINFQLLGVSKNG